MSRRALGRVGMALLALAALGCGSTPHEVKESMGHGAGFATVP